MLIFLFLAAAGALNAEPSRPNIVVVDICSARADRMGLYGYEKDTTPGLDALAKESAVFENAIAQSSWCLPNYASLFTGHVPEVHGQYSNIPFKPLPDFETTAAARLRGAGYDTAAFTGGIYMLPAWGLSKGFDYFKNSFSTVTAEPAPFERNLPDIARWLERRSEKPFFLYASVDDLHAPYQSDDPERFDPDYEGVVHDTGVPHVRFFRAYNGEPTPELGKQLADFRSDPRHLEHLKAHYDAALSQVDRGVKALIERLKKNGVWDKTVFIVTADHGEFLGEKGLLGHTEGLYEPVLRVPLLLRHPGIPSSNGQRLKQLIQRVDLTSTILDAAGVDASDAELQGESVLPYLSNQTLPGRPYAYASSKRNMPDVSDGMIDERVIRDERWKLHWYSYKDGFELYDLKQDPLEEIDVAKLNPDIVQRLAFKLLNRVEEVRPKAPGLPSGRTEHKSGLTPRQKRD